MIDSDKHEDILTFLEDHISQLVKLKVVSRAKYKEYDQLYMDYLTAESIDDDERMELYGDMIGDCNFAMWRKMKKAIEEHPELLLQDVVREYMELMNQEPGIHRK